MDKGQKPEHLNTTADMLCVVWALGWEKPQHPRCCADLLYIVEQGNRAIEQLRRVYIIQLNEKGRVRYRGRVIIFSWTRRQMKDIGRSSIQAVNMMDRRETKWTFLAHIVKVNTWTRGTLYHLSPSHVEVSVVHTGFLRSWFMYFLDLGLICLRSNYFIYRRLCLFIHNMEINSYCTRKMCKYEVQ